MLACYRRTWAEIGITDTEIARDEVYLRARTSPSAPVPDGFRRSPGGTEWFAHVSRADPELHVFDLRWRDYRVRAIGVEARPSESPLLQLTLFLGGDNVPPEIEGAGWRLVDRGIVARQLPLDDSDIHLDETVVKYAGE